MNKRMYVDNPAHLESGVGCQMKYKNGCLLLLPTQQVLGKTLSIKLTQISYIVSAYVCNCAVVLS